MYFALSREFNESHTFVFVREKFAVIATEMTSSSGRLGIDASTKTAHWELFRFVLSHWQGVCYRR